MGVERTDKETAEAMASKTAGETPIEHVIKATGYSLDGIRAGWRHEMAFRIECVLCVVLIPLLVLLPVPIVFKAVILASMLLVLTAELLNSALEWIVDYISLEKHPLAKRAKDMGSGAVFFALVNCGTM